MAARAHLLPGLALALSVAGCGGPDVVLPDRSDPATVAAEQRIAATFATDPGGQWVPMTCRVRLLAGADAEADSFGWAHCVGADDNGVETGLSTVIGVRNGQLWQPQDGAGFEQSLRGVLGPELTDWVLEHSAELAAETAPQG